MNIINLISNFRSRFLYNFSFSNEFKLFSASSKGSYTQQKSFIIRSIQSIFPSINSHFPKYKIIDVENFFKKRDYESENYLANLFNLNNSDKSITHNYHIVYSNLFKSKDYVKHLIEIGIGSNNLDTMSNMGINGTPGASLRSFKKFFSNSSIIGADIDKRILINEESIKSYYVDQLNIDSIKNLFEKNNQKFDLIIDDGLHAILPNINTLLIGIKYLKIGGYIVIEDIHYYHLDFWIFIINSKIICPKTYELNLVKCKVSYVLILKRVL